jgi:thioredoxin
MSTLKELDDATLETTIQGSKVPVIVDFFATWCGPCKALSPTLETVSTELTGKVDFYKVDIDKAENAAAQFGISAVPTVILFKNGREVERFTGNQDLRSVRDRANRLMAS